MTRRYAAHRGYETPGRRFAAPLLLLALLLSALPAAAQDARIRDRAIGGQGGQTVQSVADLLRRFDVEVPAEMLRTRNVAAVLVTAEVLPYLWAGGRFEIHGVAAPRALPGAEPASGPLPAAERPDS